MIISEIVQWIYTTISGKEGYEDSRSLKLPASCGRRLSEKHFCKILEVLSKKHTVELLYYGGKSFLSQIEERFRMNLGRIVKRNIGLGNPGNAVSEMSRGADLFFS